MEVLLELVTNRSVETGKTMSREILRLMKLYMC